MHKDVALALDTGRELLVPLPPVPLPSAATADQLLTIAGGLGYEHRDIAGLYEVLAKLAGHPVAQPA